MCAPALWRESTHQPSPAPVGVFLSQLGINGEIGGPIGGVAHHERPHPQVAPFPYHRFTDRFQVRCTYGKNTPPLLGMPLLADLADVRVRCG